jgi:hypothetical protein
MEGEPGKFKMKDRISNRKNAVFHLGEYRTAFCFAGTEGTAYLPVGRPRNTFYILNGICISLYFAPCPCETFFEFEKLIFTDNKA